MTNGTLTDAKTGAVYLSSAINALGGKPTTGMRSNAMSDDPRTWREWMNEDRPDYILAIRAQALDRVQELIEPYEDDEVPPADVWRKIVEEAFPLPPMG